MTRWIVCAVVIGACAWGGCAKRDAAPSGDAAPPPADTSTTAAPARTERIVVPSDSIGGVFEQIRAERAGLDSAITSGALDRVHEYAFAIRDLARALPIMTSTLSVDAAKQLDALVADIGRQAEELDNSADAGDVSGTQLGVSAIDKSIEGIRALYGRTQ